MLGKNRPKKVRKTFFFNSHEYRDQKIGGTKCARQFFQKHTISASKRYLEKIVGKKCEKRFLYSHEYLDQKMGGTKRSKQFFQQDTNSAIKKCWEKNRREKVRKTFFIFTRIS